jgi:hypothetical protein
MAADRRGIFDDGGEEFAPKPEGFRPPATGVVGFDN